MKNSSESAIESSLNVHKKEGWDHMCREMEILYNEGREDGAERAKRETAIKLSRRGDSATDIADVLNVSEKQVEEWLSESLVTA